MKLGSLYNKFKSEAWPSNKISFMFERWEEFERQTKIVDEIQSDAPFCKIQMQVPYAVAKKLLLGSNYKIWKWESNHHFKLLTHVKLSKFELNFIRILLSWLYLYRYFLYIYLELLLFLSIFRSSYIKGLGLQGMRYNKSKEKLPIKDFIRVFPNLWNCLAFRLIHSHIWGYSIEKWVKVAPLTTKMPLYRYIKEYH